MSEEEKLAIESITSILKQIDEGVQKIHTENLFDNIEIILKLIQKQQQEIDYLQTKTKRNENIEKIKMCMTHNMPNNAEIVCMVREDFERNFGNDYISKDKIRERKEKLKKECNKCGYKHLNICEHCHYTVRIKLINEFLEEE